MAGPKKFGAKVEKSKFFTVEIFSAVVSRNHLTTSLNSDVSKLTNRDIHRIIRQWANEKPVVEIA
ncbi:MAG: hypothetical protein ABSG28_07335, partial [Methanoregula sp.]|uniref:hypothetical protein n=1 Tax=Methanoregula sp. TaxID=2052170 RepID=UPI003C14519E